MNKELYEELREIEERLYNIVIENSEVCELELCVIWSSLFKYLEKVKTE